jgi:hypothetical protein
MPEEIPEGHPALEKPHGADRAQALHFAMTLLPGQHDIANAGGTRYLWTNVTGVRVGGRASNDHDT